MTRSVSGGLSYTYDAGDRLLTVGSDTFTWDANGSLASRTYGATTADYTFDSLDRLTQVISATTTVDSTYNGDGVRVGKSVSGTPTTYVQDLGTGLPVVLVETTGGQDTLYLYGLDLIAQVQSDGSRRYYHTDGLGSTRVLSNDTGQGVGSVAYDAFGAVRSQTDGGGNPFTFAGEQSDDELSLIYLRARYYDPTTGRFISRDPFAGAVTDSRDLNRYVYAQNNPVSFVDPDGQVVVATVAIGAVAGAVVNTSWYAVETWVDPQQEFHWEKAAGKAVGGAVSGGLTGLGILPGVGGGAIRGATGYVVEQAVENILKYGGDVSRIGEGITTERLIGKALEGGLAAGVIGGIENTPGYLKPNLGASPGQLHLFQNTYGAGVREVAEYMFAKELIGKGLTHFGFGLLWNRFVRETQHGLVGPVYAPIDSMFGTGASAGWGGPPSSGK